MDRINGADHVDIGSGRRGFRDENLETGIAGTEVTAAWLNAIQEEIAEIIEGAGLEMSAADWSQLGQALQRGKLNFAEAGGTANAWTATLSPAPAALTVGLQVRLKVATMPTGPLTLAVNGLGEKPVLKGDGDPVTYGYFVAGEIVSLTFDGEAWRSDNAIRRDGDYIRATVVTEGSWQVRSANHLTTQAQMYINNDTGHGVFERRRISDNLPLAQVVLRDNIVEFTDNSPSTTNNLTVKISGSSAGLDFDNCGGLNLVALGWTGSAIAFRVDSTNVGTVTPSDGRLKTDVEDVSSALEQLNQLRPVSFLYDQSKSPIGFATGKQFGFIAQEMEQVLPALVSEWTMNTDDPENTTYKQVDLLKLVPLLVRAIQEQQAQIAALQSSLNK